jgi:hypothetical protein
MHEAQHRDTSLPPLSSVCGRFPVASSWNSEESCGRRETPHFPTFLTVNPDGALTYVPVRYVRGTLLWIWDSSLFSISIIEGFQFSLFNVIDTH